MFHTTKVLRERMGWLPDGVCIGKFSPSRHSFYARKIFTLITASSSYCHCYRLCSRTLWLGPTYILRQIQRGGAPAILQSSCASILCTGIELRQDGHCCVVLASNSWHRDPHTSNLTMDSRDLGLYRQHYGYHHFLHCMHSNREIMEPFD